MPIDLKDGYNKSRSKINSIKTTVDTQENSKKITKQKDGNNFENSKSESIRQINELGDKKQRLQNEIKNQFEELIDLFKISSRDSKVSNSNSIDFLVRQVLGAAQNTKTRITELFIDETLKTAGCSEEQQFDGNQPGVSGNKIYIRVNQIDIFKLLNKDPEDKFNTLLYESEPFSNGLHPYPMNRQLYRLLQNEGNSYSNEYGLGYIGASNSPIMDIKYVTSYDVGGTTYYGDYYEITLSNRPAGNNVSDFLRDYYSSIDLLDFDKLSINILNSLTNIVDIKANITTSEKENQSKFQKILQRIMGLCFDENQEIDVSGNAKNSVLDRLDNSFFEMSPMDLRNIEVEVNNVKQGVTEFEDCGNIKIPVNTQSITESIEKITFVPDNRKIDALIESVEKMSKDEQVKSMVPSGINIDISIKNGLLKTIPTSVINTIISPKALLGLMIVFKSVGSTVMDNVEDVETFIQNMKTFMVNLVSKVGAIFVEELFLLLKANIKQLVEILLMEILKEAKSAQIKMISGVLYVLIQLSSLAKDWRKCKSVVDEILKLLDLGLSTSYSRLPTFALAGSGLLGGFSPTRAMANITENLQSLGLPTGDLPDGSPNMMLPSIFETIKGQQDEQLANGKTEIFIPPLAVVALGAGTTLPSRGIGKSF